MKFKIFIFLLLTLIITNHVFAQELKSVKLKNRKRNIKEEYYVYSENPEIKHGKYKYYRSNKLLLIGEYQNNEKNGQWVILNEIGDTLKIGQMQNDKYIGLWHFYKKGQLHFEFDFDKYSLINYNRIQDETDSIFVLIDKDWVKVKIDSPPLDIDALASFEIFQNLIHEIFKTLRANRILVNHQTAFVRYVIDEKGNVLGKKLIQGINPLIDKVISEWLENSDFKFYPAILNNQAISSVHDFPIKISMGY